MDKKAKIVHSGIEWGDVFGELQIDFKHYSMGLNIFEAYMVACVMRTV